jgi:sirohydrochlorin ferrochelatase
MPMSHLSPGLLPCGHGEPLDRLRSQLIEAQSRLERARRAGDHREVAHWEAVVERIVQRGQALERNGSAVTGATASSRKPSDMREFIRGQLGR